MIDCINLTAGATAPRFYSTFDSVYPYYGPYGCINESIGRFGIGRDHFDCMFHYQPRLPMDF